MGVLGIGLTSGFLQPSKGSGTTKAAGNDTDIQFNNAGNFAGDDNLTWDKTSQSFSVTGKAGSTIALLEGPTETNGIEITDTDVVMIANETGAALTLESDSGIDVTTRTGGIQIGSNDSVTQLSIDTVTGNIAMGSTNPASIRLSAASMAFFDVVVPIAKPDVTGSKASGAALVSLLAAFVALGLITDSTTV